MGDDLERMAKDQDIEQVSMDEIEAEDATALPNKEVMSLLDVNANVDLGLNLAAPVDLAAAANLNVAAPIEAAASANLLSADAEATAIAQQHGTIDQGISGSAEATAPQNAEITQDANPEEPGAADGAGTDAAAAIPAGDAADGAAGVLPDAGGVVPDTGEVVPDTGGVVPDTGGVVPDTGGVVPDVGDATGDVTGGVNSLLEGGSLLDANVNIHANADLAAPVNGAIAANANVAAPINAAIAANVLSDNSVAYANATQDVTIDQSN
jgi:hypothetical protein